MLRLHHNSMHTERSYVGWIVRCVRFHGMRSRADLVPAEPTIASFLTDLTVHGYVAALPSTKPCMPWCSSPSASSTTPWRDASMPCAPPPLWTMAEGLFYQHVNSFATLPALERPEHGSTRLPDQSPGPPLCSLC